MIREFVSRIYEKDRTKLVRDVRVGIECRTRRNGILYHPNKIASFAELMCVFHVVFATTKHFSNDKFIFCDGECRANRNMSMNGEKNSSPRTRYTRCVYVCECALPQQ